MNEIIRTSHDLISRKLLLPLSRLQRMARPSRRAVIKAYYEGMNLRRRADHWGADKKLDWILQRLRFVVRRAYAETDYYQQLFNRIGFNPNSPFSFDEFSQLPVLERDHLQGTGAALLSRAVPNEQLLRDSTGGSTGAPAVVWLGHEERGWKESAGEYFMRRLGLPGGVRTAFLWGHHLDPVVRDSLRDRFYAFETNSLYFDCLRLSSSILEQYHNQFERYRPRCIVAYASALGHLAEHVLERGHRPHYPTSCFVTGAEKLLPHHRDAIQAAFGRPVHERYGGRDVGYVAFQMNPRHDLAYEVDWAN
ncbi:MAG: hypothetical protein WAV47_19865, partial [Blastocatellia bacterium]